MPNKYKNTQSVVGKKTLKPLTGLTREQSKVIRRVWKIMPKDSLEVRIKKRKLLERPPTAKEKAVEDAILKKKHQKIQKADDLQHKLHRQKGEVDAVMRQARWLIKRQEDAKKKRDLLGRDEEAK